MGEGVVGTIGVSGVGGERHHRRAGGSRSRSRPGRAACSSCGTWAQPNKRMGVAIGDLQCFDRPVGLAWAQAARWRAVSTGPRGKDLDRDLAARLSSGHSSSVAPRRRRTVSARTPPSSQGIAPRSWGCVGGRSLGAVIADGRPLVDDPGQVRPTDKLAVDETSWLKANRAHGKLYATGMVDLDAGKLIDMIEGNASSDLRARPKPVTRRGWSGSSREHRPGRIDPAALSSHLAQATFVATRSMSRESATAAWTR